MFKKLWCDEEGASMTEYTLLIAVIALVAYATIKTFGEDIQKLFQSGADVVGDANEQVKKFPIKN